MAFTRVFDEAAEYLRFATDTKRSFAPLLAKAKAAISAIPERRRAFYEAHLITAVGINLYSNRALCLYCRALQEIGFNNTNGLRWLELATVACDDLFTVIHAAERGKWDFWNIGGSSNGLERSRDVIREAQAVFSGQPLLPARTYHGYYQIYKYQQTFESNFPLLYGKESNEL